MRTDYFNYTDAQLADLYNQRDRYAFEAIYERYWDLLYIHAKKMLQDDDQAQDVVQELFTSLFTSMGKLELKSAFSSYLYQSIRYMVFNLIKHSKVKLNYASDIKAFFQEADYSTDNLVIENDLKRIIEKEIDRLPPKMRTIFEMSKKAYLTNQEIAMATNTSEENIRRQLRLASERVRAKIVCSVSLQIMTTLLWMSRNF